MFAINRLAKNESSKYPNTSCQKTCYLIFPRSKFKGCGMGPLLVLVSPCFRENVVVTCKIWCFLCSLDNLLQKNVIGFFFGNQIQNGSHLKKKNYFMTYFSHFLVTSRGKLQKFLQHISHSHTYMYFALTLLTFFALPLLKKNTNLSGMVSLWYDSWF